MHVQKKKKQKEQRKHKTQDTRKTNNKTTDIPKTASASMGIFQGIKSSTGKALLVDSTSSSYVSLPYNLVLDVLIIINNS